MKSRLPEHEEQLSCLLEQLTARLRAGENLQPEQLARDYPQFAGDLRELWGTLLLAENLAIPSGTESLSGIQTSPACKRFPSDQLPGFEILEEIGRGGMGVVYRARQQVPQRIVALKMLLRPDWSGGDHRSRFRSEAEAAGTLDHPHIVRVFEVGEADGDLYFTMPFIEGTTLARLIAEGPLSGREAARLLVPVCRGIAAAHARGILHRDLKPSNILIDRTGTPFVSDFGLAKRMPGSPEHQPGEPSLTETGAILGTPGYMAPEQASGMDEIGPAADIYGLGAVLYAAVTGRPPFQSSNPVDVLLMIREQDPPPPRLLSPQIDPDLEMIILKSLQKPADLRYATAGQLADDLEAWLRDEPVSARSSHFSQIISRVFRPTHHFAVLENWGLLWMWHGVVILLLCLITDFLQRRDVAGRMPYVLLWTVGLGAWGIIFWNLRRRSGPVTFVERQVAHVWAASMVSSSALFGVEWLMGLPVLTLSPVLAVIAGAVFIAKAGILSGEFYLHAAALFATSAPMALFPEWALPLFGVVLGGIFAGSGWRFYRMREGRTLRRRPADGG